MTGEAVFFVPHQDDEILTMGAYIRQHVESARDIAVVLVSDGQASGARTKLKNQTGYDLSESAFSKARDREFIDCLVRLGVTDTSKIHFENVLDGALTLAKAKSIINKYVALYDGGSYKTMSWMDAHKDHYLLGRAMDELNNAGSIPNADARFCRSFLYPEAATPGGSNQSATNSAVIYASEAYGVWAPTAVASANDMASGPRYGIGELSVPSMFADLRANPVTFVHVGSYNYSASKRTEANNWLTSKGLTAYL